MVKNREETPPQSKAQNRAAASEEVWIREFLEFSGTDNITRIYRADLRGVSLTRAIEAICLGEFISSEKVDDGPGTICTFRHDSEDNVVEVEVFFVANEMVLEIRRADVVEGKGETNDAA